MLTKSAVQPTSGAAARDIEAMSMPAVVSSVTGTFSA
jgi:hypothetical protein